jgi:transposase-like protein
MRGKTHRRFSTELNVGVVEAYLVIAPSLKGLVTKAVVDHSLVHYWRKKYRTEKLSLDLHREAQLVETEQHIADLERKVGQLTVDLELLKRRLIAAPATSGRRSFIISGPAGSASDEDVA